MKSEVIFIADDFGMSEKINAAILRAHQSGNLHGASLMMAQPGTDEAVAMARANPGLSIGWHLHLNDSLPATIERWPWGASPARASLSIAFSRKARAIMYCEITRQWDLFKATGLSCDFINSHHHLHAQPVICRTLLDVVGRDFAGWIRLGRVRFFSPGFKVIDTAKWVGALFQRGRKLSTLRSTDTLWGMDRLFSMRAWEVQEAIATLPEGFHEFLFHPRGLSCPDTQCLLELKTLLRG